MAVEIPVYVNITGAFDQAVKAIPKEMPKLERAISKNVLNIPVYWTGAGFSKVQDALTSTTINSKQLKQVLHDLEYQFNRLSQSEAGNSRTSAKVKNLAKAYALVEQRLKGFYNANTSAMMMVENAINKVKFKINDLKGAMSSLTVGSEAYNKTNYQLQIQRQRLAELETQLIKYRSGLISAGNSGAASVDKVSASMSRQRTLITQLTGYFSGLYAVFAIGRFIKSIRDVTGELEYQRVALGHLLQDVSFGNQLFDDIVEAAKKSPFRITQLVTYTKQLAAYQIEQEKIYDTTMRLADISAGLGVDMNRLILAYGQVRAASVLRGQELRQFTEAGIPLVEKLAEKFEELGRKGTTTADVFKLISQRAVPFEMVKQIFEDMTDAGGMFYKMQEEQAKTLRGRWEKLKDAYDQALMRIGNDSTFQSWNDTVLNILNAIARNLKGIVRVVNAGTVAWVTYSIATNKAVVSTARFSVEMIKEFGLMATLKLGVESLAASFRKLMAAMASNWVGLALTALAGLVTFFTTFRSKTKGVSEDLSDLQKEIERMKNANKQFEFGKSLIHDYEELAKKTERTTAESVRMLDTVNELERAYPELSNAIDYDNMTLQERIGIMNEVIEKSHEMAVEEAKQRIHEKREVLRGMEEEARAAKLKQDSARRRLEQAEYAEKSGGGDMVGGSDLVRDLAKETANAANEADAATTKYENLKVEIAKLKKEIEELEKLIDPQKKSQGWEQWAIEIKKLQESMKGLEDGVVFDDQELEGFHSIYELSGKLKKKIDDLKTSLTGMKSLLASMTDKDSDAYKNLSDEIKSNEKLMEMAEAIRIALGLTFGKSKSGGSDNRLSNLKNEISEATNAYKKYLELLKYMSKEQANREMLDLFPQLNGETPDFDRTLNFLESKLKDVQAKIKKIPKDKVLLDMQRTLNTEISNLKFDKLKEKIDTELKNLSDEVKRSEAARGLFNDLVGLTGDEQFATTLTMQVYGQTGDEFKDRVQKEMIGALESVKDITGEDLFNELVGDVTLFDMDEIRRQLKNIPETIRPTFERLLDENDKYNTDVAKNYAKLLLKFDEMEQQRVNVTNQAAEDIKAIERGLALEIEGIDKDLNIKDKEAAKARARERAKAATEGVEGERDLQLSRLERDYRLFFSSVGVISDEAAQKVAQNQKRMIADQFAKGQKTLAQYKRELKEIDDQLNKYRNSRNMVITFLGGGFDAVADKIAQYEDGLLAIADNLKLIETEGGVAFSEEDKEYIDKVGALMGGKMFGVEGRKDVSEKLIDKIAEISKTPDEFKKNMKDALIDASKNAGSFAANMKQGLSTAGFWVTNVSTLIKELDAFNQDSLETPKWLDTLASTVTWTLGVAGDEAWDRLANLNEYATSGFEKLSQGNIVGAIVDNIKGLVDFWGPNIKKIERDLKNQKKLLESLEESYGDLERAIEKAFGSDYVYNYNEQLKNLAAQQEAYLAQAELERSKGKKADKDAISDYERSARDTARKIEDMQSQLSEFFTDSDITSAATDFANSWIEAYKEFGNTTDAMREKFDEMIQNMVVKSLAAQVMKNILTPVMNAVDEYAKDGDLDASEIASISRMTKDSLGQINSAMSTLVSDLGANGINLRNTAGSFTGISRSFAGASEESINTLTAATNTQNFYMSYMPMISENVARILEVMGGDATRKTPVGANIGAVDYYTQMLQYAADIPTMSENLAALLAAVNSIITPKALSTNTHCVAVK